jgi:hypothetical protein
MVSVGRGALTLERPANTNRTLVLCFYGTGDKFDPDVRKAFACPPPPPRSLSDHNRIRTSCSSYRCWRKTTNTSRWSTQARSSERPYGRVLTCGTEDWNKHICRETRSGVLVPNCQKMSKLVDETVAWNPASHLAFILGSEVLLLDIYGSFVSRLRIINATLSVPLRMTSSHDSLLPF